MATTEKDFRVKNGLIVADNTTIGGTLTVGGTTLAIPSGSIVGTSDTQTLTNKTINLTSNTLSGTTAEFNTALSDGSFATLAGIETFTNKSGNISQWTNDSGYLTSFTETNDLTTAVTWANVPDANITQSSVTQHQAALAITESQITDLQSYITASSIDTLTNKTISGASNTISNIGNGSLTNSTITVTDGITSTATALGGTITFSGTSNEVEVSESAGTITIGLPNDVTVSNDLTVTGNLTVNGTTTTLNTTTLDVEDLNITVAKGAANAAAADGAGITIDGAAVTLTYVNTTGRLTSNTAVSAPFFHGDGSNLTNLPATGDPAGTAVAMAIALG
jgi:hypothetical protein